MGLQRNGAQAGAYGSFEALGYGWEAVDRIPDDLRAVTADDVIAAARAVFIRDNAVIVKMLPEE